mmetsp:Transcript_50547/g.120173  ORF Transcript_50547/g.120173 Transcript_50547/m.120173 type:complete len:200 (-) Transcript_50547:1796-2395(-)
MSGYSRTLRRHNMQKAGRRVLRARSLLQSLRLATPLWTSHAQLAFKVMSCSIHLLLKLCTRFYPRAPRVNDRPCPLQAWAKSGPTEAMVAFLQVAPIARLMMWCRKGSLADLTHHPSPRRISLPQRGRSCLSMLMVEAWCSWATTKAASGALTLLRARWLGCSGIQHLSRWRRSIRRRAARSTGVALHCGRRYHQVTGT